VRRTGTTVADDGWRRLITAGHGDSHDHESGTPLSSRLLSLRRLLRRTRGSSVI
jgi:hypothetical protein